MRSGSITRTMRRRRPDVRPARHRRAPAAERGGCRRGAGAGTSQPDAALRAPEIVGHEHRRRVRCRILSGAQSRRGGGGRRSALPLQHLRLARGPQSECVLRHRRLSGALRRRGGRGRQSAAALRGVRLEGRPRSVSRLRHAGVSRGEPGCRRGARQSARPLPAVRRPRGPRRRSTTGCGTDAGA